MSKSAPPPLETNRLLLRRWKKSDLKSFIKLNADPQVMKYFPSILTEKESEELLSRIEEKFEKDGFCFWAAELKATGDLIGMVGLNIPSFKAHFTPCVEIGWRLKYESWGQGYASEAAQKALHFGFETLRLKEIISFTTQGNLRSRRVMERIGMTYDVNGDFIHPGLAKEHPLARHVLYRMKGARSDPMLEKKMKCPYCFEVISMVLDLSINETQTYIEDCEVCCRPIQIEFTVHDNELEDFSCRGLG